MKYDDDISDLISNPIDDNPEESEELDDEDDEEAE